MKYTLAGGLAALSAMVLLFSYSTSGSTSGTIPESSPTTVSDSEFLSGGTSLAKPPVAAGVMEPEEPTATATPTVTATVTKTPVPTPTVTKTVTEAPTVPPKVTVTVTAKPSPTTSWPSDGYPERKPYDPSGS